MSTENKPTKPNSEKAKPATDKPAATKTAPPGPAKPAPAGPIKLPPLFRRIDWLAMLIAFGVVWVVYFFTLAPEVTLEDSGELCTGSFYAGIPHPPGYPFWAIYSWLWTVLLPVGNVAWRVEVGEATAAALGCGFVGLMVSRASSMLIEGIQDLKELSRNWEGLICVVCGAASGILLGFGYTMWSESVAINRISLFGVPWVMTVLLCVMRWIYSPRQWQYLFIAMFFFGICATIHQTLLVAALGIEAAVICAHPRLGRTFCFGNSVIFLAGLIAHGTHITTALDTAPMLLYIFFTVGIVSIAGYIALAIVTKETTNEFIMDAGLAAFMLFGTLAVSKGAFFGFLALIGLGIFIYEIVNTRKLGLEWVVAIVCLILWGMGAAFYLYEPISGMTNPPMEWGYPRTVEGFFHALSRGQYEKANPTDIFADPGRFANQLWFLIHGIAEEFNWILLFITIIPFLFFRKLQRRERALLVGLAATYFCIGVLLVILMNPGDDLQSVSLHRVFFASSHGVVAVLFGMGLALICAYMATHYQRFRQWGLAGGGIAAVLGLYSLWDAIGKHYKGLDGVVAPQEMPYYIMKAFGAHQYGLPVFGALILFFLPLIFLAALYFYRDRAPLLVTLAVFAAMPLSSALWHWGTSEQRNHWWGYWFGHDMFTPPYGIYPEMTRDAILFGGTDPGRFCPTYMIFCESFIPHKDQPKQDQKFDRRDVYIITQNALADPTYLDYIRAQYNRSTQIDPPFFQELLRSDFEKSNNYTTNALARMAYGVLDKPLTKFGAKVEARRREEGVYPPKEIYIPTPGDSSVCFSEYMNDAAQRYAHDQQFPLDKYPNEPRQMKPGEEVHPQPNGQISVAGQVAVMSINGLLTKVIFDHNPSNEFFVEESFPLDWMYPYETPFGIIMKINRQPLDHLSEDIIAKDHDFWSRYSERTIGNWMTYDTTVPQVGQFIEKVYLEHDLTGFKGNSKFVRDDQAQKAFSKLRNAIGGIYDWRFQHPKDAPDQQRMLREAEFAYRQAWAFCPYSPEAVFRYINLLLRMGRVDDALTVATTCQKLDPNNLQVRDTIKQLNAIKARSGNAAPQAPVSLQQMEKEWHDNPTNFQAAFNLAASYLQSQQNDKAMGVLDEVLKSPKADVGAIVFLARTYAQMSNSPKLEASLERLTQLEPSSAEAWYDLAALKAGAGKTTEAIDALRHCLEENTKRLAINPKAQNLAQMVAGDPRFNLLHASPEYQKLMAPK